MFFLVVVMLLCRGVAYAYSPSVNVPISKVEGIEQDIPPPHVTPPPLPSQVFLHVGEIADHRPGTSAGWLQYPLTVR